MADEFNPSEDLARLLSDALDHAIDMVARGCSPFMPFAMVEPLEGQGEPMAFAVTPPDEPVDYARGILDSKAAETRMYALAWDGFLTVDGERTDAVFVEAADRSNDRAVVVAERYRPTRKGLLRKRSCELVGDPIVVERPPSRLAVGETGDRP